MSNKSITFFICSLGSGGAEHQLTMLANFLSEKGYGVTITTFAGDTDHYAVDGGVGRVRLGVHKGKMGQLCDIIRYFLTLKTDVVIAFGQRESVFALLPLLFRRRIKVISGDRNFTIGKPSFWERLLMSFLHKRSDFIVPNSFSQARHIQKVEPTLTCKIRVITNFTDTDKFRQHSYTPNDHVRLCVLCRYHNQKNGLRFIEAIRIVKSKINVPFVVEWYGNKTFKNKEVNEYYVRMQRLVEQYGLCDCVRLNHHVKNVVELLPTFDATILPSIYEGFSNSISEAICCGRPMLVSDVSDNGVMVHNGENGYLFNPLDVNDMADAICKFLSLSREERMAMSARSRSIAESLFDKERFVNGYIHLIES